MNLTDAEIDALRERAIKTGDGSTDIGRRFARAIEQTVEAKYKPVAYVMQPHLDALKDRGRLAVVLYGESVSPLDVPLYAIPKEETQ